MLLAFDFSKFTFRILTVERPSPALRATLRSNDYIYVGDHGCFGDQMWVHRSMASQAERTLKLTLDATLDVGQERWFGNCSAASYEQAHRLRPAAQVQAAKKNTARAGRS